MLSLSTQDFGYVNRTLQNMKTYQDVFGANRRAALIPFFVLGDPDRKRSLELIKTAIDAGADILELGIPFSDPIADGPTIQKADIRALEQGITCETALEMIDEIKQKVQALRYDEARKLVRNYFGRDDRNTKYWSQFINEKEDLHSNLQKGRMYFRAGEILNRRGDYIGAAHKFERALKNFQAYDDKRLIATTNLNLAISYRILLRNRDSLENFKVAVDISRENGFRECEAKALQGCGLLYGHLGRYEKAFAYLDEALTIHEVLEDRRGEAVDWLIKGFIKYNSNTPGAGNHFRKALAISKEIGDPVIQLRADTLLNNWLNRPSVEALPTGSALPSRGGSQVEES